MYMYCYYFIIQGMSLMHQAANYNKLQILGFVLKSGGDSNIQNDVSDYTCTVALNKKFPYSKGTI